MKLIKVFISFILFDSVIFPLLEMNLKMTFPPGFSIYGDVKYPVLMKVYGGPNSQSVEQTYGFDFMTSIADSGFIAVIVDGRGTGFKGREYRSCVSKNLGKFEVDDQIYLAKYDK